MSSKNLMMTHSNTASKKDGFCDLQQLEISAAGKVMAESLVLIKTNHPHVYYFLLVL